MKFRKTHINGLLILEPDVFNDDRGFFFESYNQKKFEKEGFAPTFVQDNTSKSVYGTIRGLHYQIPPAEQGKLVQVLQGSVLDVALDIRFGSPTFGNVFSIELSDKNHFQLWIPPGFAHGFSVISDEAIFYYKCTNFYNPEFEKSIIFNDNDIKIDWKVGKPLLSPKDLLGKNFRNIDKDFLYKE